MTLDLSKIEADIAAAEPKAKMNPTPEAIRLELWKISQIPKLTSSERNKLFCDAVVDWLHSRGEFFHHAARPDFNGAMFFDSTRKLLLKIRADAFLAWLSDALTMNKGERHFQLIQAAVEVEALTDRAQAIEPAAFWASRTGACYVSSGPGRMTRMTAAGVECVDNGTDGVLFPADAVLPPWEMTTPQDPFERCSLFRDMATSAPHGKMLFQLWACSLPTDQKTKPFLITTGTVGSGKTRAIVGLFELLGIAPRVGTVSKNGEGDFWTTVNEGGLVCFDNADTRVDWFQDALQIASTGGCSVKRRLYTDNENSVLRARSWVAITSSNPSFAAESGLADRLLVVRLLRRVGETAEASLSNEIAVARDAGLSWICHTIHKALADSATVPTGLNQRHPDFAAFAVRLGRAMGREAEAIAALSSAEADKSLFNLENDTIGAVLLESMRSGLNFYGTAAELLERLKTTDPTLDSHLSARRLGKRIARLWPHLVAVLQAVQETAHGGSMRYHFKPPIVAGSAIVDDEDEDGL